MPEQLTAEDAEAARTAEYGVYVATEDIRIDGALAFRTGDPVPASHVDRGVVVKEQVAKSSTKAAQAAVQTATTVKEG